MGVGWLVIGLGGEYFLFNFVLFCDCWSEFILMSSSKPLGYSLSYESS